MTPYRTPDPAAEIARLTRECERLRGELAAITYADAPASQVERTPGREVRPGVSAATWWGDEDLRARLERLAPPPAEFRREYMGTFPDPVRPPPPPDVMTLETLDRLVQLLKDAPGPPPGAIVVPPWAARVASDPYYPDGLADAWGDPTLDGWRREGIERRALATTGRVLVAWLIGRWRR